MVGVTGLEPMASWSRTKRDTKLRHTPKRENDYTNQSGKNQVFSKIFFIFIGFLSTYSKKRDYILIIEIINNNLFTICI